MIKKQSSLKTTVVALDDGKHTFGISRKWDEDRRTGVIIELYPTISADKACEMDLSTMHLMNHVRDFDWGEVRIVNLYSTVFIGKPTTSMLGQDMENVAYIENILDGADSVDMDIVITWGSSLSTISMQIILNIRIQSVGKKGKNGMKRSICFLLMMVWYWYIRRWQGMDEKMFRKGEPSYKTREINERLPMLYQILLWDTIDNLRDSRQKLDYL